MNHAYRSMLKRQARRDRASATLGVLGLILLAIVAGAMVYQIATVTPGWWLAQPLFPDWPK